MAQLGARFHGMEEVESSNLSRSTSPTRLPKDDEYCFIAHGVRGTSRALYAPQLELVHIVIAGFFENQVRALTRRPDVFA